MGSSSKDFSIAGDKTNDDWRNERKTLVGGEDAARWAKIFREYFEARLRTRYLEPVHLLQERGMWEGEGFSIVAIQCSLIEFLQSTVEGMNYRLKKPQPPHEYNTSADMFKRFLISHAPFKSVFTTTHLAGEFYENVRCPVLHEARTTGGWRIHAENSPEQPRVVDIAQKIVYRNDFQMGLELFIAEYGQSLQTNRDYQEAFIRKYDALAS